MQTLIRTFVLLSTVLIIGCASGPSGKSFDSAIGEWRWTWEIHGFRKAGDMTIIDETKAPYGYRDGRIIFYAIDDQGKWEGHWVGNSGPVNCSDKKDGSTHWGVAILQFNDAYNNFRGTWDFCGDGVTYDWDGDR